jgi:hypothetical protein
VSVAEALSGLLGGSQQRQDDQDFVSRYAQGHPAEGYDDAEVLRRYQQVAPRLPPQDDQQAAQAAFERMSPAEREQFAQYVHHRARQQGATVPGWPAGGGSQRYPDPGALAEATSRVHQQDPDLLGQLLGPGGALGSPVAKAALAGVAAVAASRFLSGRR